MKSYPIHCKSKTLKRYNSKNILPTKEKKLKLDPITINKDKKFSDADNPLAISL